MLEKKPRVLFVDPEMCWHLRLCDALTNVGFEVIQLNDLNKALEKLCQRGVEIDVIVTELMLPHGADYDVWKQADPSIDNHLGGLVLMKLIRQTIHCEHFPVRVPAYIPIIVLTAKIITRYFRQDQLDPLSPCAVLDKPIFESYFVATVQSALS